MRTVDTNVWTKIAGETSVPAVPPEMPPRKSFERPLPEPEYIPGFNPISGTFG